MLTTNVFAVKKKADSYKAGQGSLKLTESTANWLEFFFSGGKKGVYKKKQKEVWKPGLIAISIDGREYSFFRHPWYVDQMDSTNYAGIAIAKCKKRSGTQCFLFANGYKIVWDNGTDKKKRRLKRRDIKAGKTLQILHDLGFYDGPDSENKSVILNDQNSLPKKKKVKSSNFVDQIKELNELYKSGVLTKEEFIKAKEKILNN